MLTLSFRLQGHAAELDALRQSLSAEHTTATSLLAEQHVAAQRSLSDQHAADLEALQASHAEAFSEQQTAHATLLGGVTSSHQGELEKVGFERDEATKQTAELKQALLESEQERERLIEQVQQLKATQGQHETLAKDLETSRSSVVKLEADLVQARQERDAVTSQLARLSVGHQSLAMSNGTGPGSPDLNGLGSSTSESMTPERAMSPTNDVGRSSPGSRHDSRMLSQNGLPSGKPPPPTPPPSMPPPPTPTNLPALPNGVRSVTRSSSSSSAGRNSISANDTTPGTSVRSDSTTIDPRISKKFEEQESQASP